MNLKLKKFNPYAIGDDKVCVFIGKRGTGKSTLVTDILYCKRHLPIGVVMSATEEGNHHYQKFVPDSLIYNDYEKEAVERILQRQRTLIGKGSKNAGAFLLLDDCMYDKKFMKDTCIRQCFMNGRHWKLFFMLTMQYCMDLTPDLRANVDYVFVLRENIIQNREKIFKSFFGVFPNFDSFNQVMDQCTENYECLVLDNTSKSNKIEDCVFYYKARLHDNFKVGSRELWNHHKNIYRPSPADPNATTNARKPNKIKVVKN